MFQMMIRHQYILNKWGLNHSSQMLFARSLMWPSKFEDPLTSKKEINSIRRSPEYERKVNVPIKAALKTASCSMFRDPLLTRFINQVQESSKGQVGENIMLETCRRIKVSIFLFGKLL